MEAFERYIPCEFNFVFTSFLKWQIIGMMINTKTFVYGYILYRIYVYIYVHTHTHTYVCMYVYTHTYTDANIHT